MFAGVYVPESVAVKLNTKENMMYSVLRKFINYETKQCFPSISTLADLIGWCENTVRKWLRSIERKGIITIEERKIIKNGKVWNTSNLYTFLHEGVLQKNNKDSSNVEGERKYNELNELIDPEKIRTELLEKFGQKITDKALKQLEIITKKGTIISNLKAYLTRICQGIQAQMEMVKFIKDKPKKEMMLNPTTVKHRNKFNNFDGQSSKYSKEQLEEMFRSKL